MPFKLVNQLNLFWILFASTLVEVVAISERSVWTLCVSWQDVVLSTSVSCCFRSGAVQDPNYCGSCYGARPDGQCCNTCQSVREAYYAMKWTFTNPKSIEQVSDRARGGPWRDTHLTSVRIRGSHIVHTSAWACSFCSLPSVISSLFGPIIQASYRAVRKWVLLR